MSRGLSGEQTANPCRRSQGSKPETLTTLHPKPITLELLETSGIERSWKGGLRAAGLGTAGMVTSEGALYTTITEFDPKRPSLLWFGGTNSIVVHMDPRYLISESV